MHDLRLVKADSNVWLVVLEVDVSREDGKVAAVGHGADEQIDRRPRDAVRSANVEKARRLVIVGRDDLQMAEIVEPLLDRVEALRVTDPREDLLTNWTDEDRFSRSHKPNPLLDQAPLPLVQASGSPAQSE